MSPEARGMRALLTAVLCVALALGLVGCGGATKGTGSGSTGEATAPVDAAQVAEATKVFKAVSAAMAASEIPPADVDLHASVLTALEARRAAMKSSAPTTGPTDAAMGAAVSEWRSDFKFADNASVARAVDDITAKLTESANLSDAEAVIWVTYRDVLDVLGLLGQATEVTPDSDGWVSAKVPDALGGQPTRTVRVQLVKDGEALRIVGVDLGGTFAGSKTPPTTP